MARSTAAETPPRWPYALLVLLFCFGVILRFYRIGADSLWIDEFITLKISSLPLREIWAANLSNNSFEPPFYFWLVHEILGVFGSSEAVMRAPSAIAGALTIPGIWLLTREITGDLKAPLLAAALLTFNPLHLWYSQEARPYALLVLFACAALVCLAHAFRTRAGRWWVGFCGFTVLAVFTHLMGILLLVAAWAWGLTWSNRRQRAVRLMQSTAGVLACVGPLLLAIGEATVRTPGTGSPARPITGLELAYTGLTYVTGYSFGPSVRDMQDIGTLAALSAHWVESVLGVAAVMGTLLLIVRYRHPSMRGFSALLGSYLLVTIMASAATGKAYSVRYTLPGLIGFLGLASIAIERLRSSRRFVWFGLLLGLFAWSDAQWFFSRAYHKDDSRAAAAWLSAHLPAGSTVEVAPAYVAPILAHYAPSDDSLRFVPATPRTWPAHTPAGLALTRLHHVSDPTALVETFRALTGGNVDEHEVVGYRIYIDPRLR